ncbi:MAG: ribonuclease E/G, partial [Clostridia bacterium]|nr:ribonuclease E/G [Clostridia bacterium]
NFVGVSRKITDEKIRQKLFRLAEDLRPEGRGLIIRTAGEKAPKSDIKREISFLVKQYEEIEAKYKNSKAPCCVHTEGDLALRMVRDVYDARVENFIVSDKETYDKIYDYASRADRVLKSKLRYFDKKTDMFRYYGLDGDVESLTGNVVRLENGAYLVFDKTEALTVIDVNTGSFVGNDSLEDTVFSTNLLAASEIARQLRLRNIAGIIIVDFIDMLEESHRAALISALKAALEGDREKCNVVGMSELGLVEITRKKRRRESVSMLLKSCPYCQGSGLIRSNEYTVMKIRTALMDLFADGYDNAIIDLNVEIADYILSKKILKKDLDRFYKGKRIYIIPHKTYHQHFFLIKGDNNRAMEIPEKAILLY